jgi:hypothetical protein
MLMPANMIDVIGPIIDNDGQHYEQIDSSQVKNPPSPDGYYYAYDAGVVAALKDADGVSIDKGSTALTFSPAHGVSDPDGEFISLTDADGLDWGMYEMASASALEDTYWGGRINGGHYIIRPPTARRLSLYNGAGDRVTTTVNVEYWVYPQPMTAKHIFFPDQWEDALRLAAWIETMTDTVDTKGESVRTSRQKEYEVALGFAMIADGKAPMRDLKRDNRGKTRRMGWR